MSRNKADLAEEEILLKTVHDRGLLAMASILSAMEGPEISLTTRRELDRDYFLKALKEIQEKATDATDNEQLLLFRMLGRLSESVRQYVIEVLPALERMLCGSLAEDRDPELAARVAGSIVQSLETMMVSSFSLGHGAAVAGVLPHLEEIWVGKRALGGAKKGGEQKKGKWEDGTKKILELRAKGLSYAQIAQKTGMKSNTVARLCQRHDKDIPKLKEKAKGGGD